MKKIVWCGMALSLIACMAGCSSPVSPSNETGLLTIYTIEQAHGYKIAGSTVSASDGGHTFSDEDGMARLIVPLNTRITITVTHPFYTALQPTWTGVVRRANEAITFLLVSK